MWVRRDQSPPTQSDVEAFRLLRNGTDNEVFREFFSVDDRNRPGIIKEFDENFGQVMMGEYTQRCLDLEKRMEYDKVLAGKETYIDRLQERYESGEKIYDEEIGLKLLVGKSRQHGISTKVGHIALRRAMAIDGYRALTMAHHAESAQVVFGIPDLSYQRFPVKYLNIKAEAKIQQADRLVLKSGGSIRVRTAGSSKRDATDATRSDKFDFYHFSEYAHYKTFNDASQILSIAPRHAWIIKESTAKGTSGPFYTQWKQAMYVWEVEEAYEAQDAERLSEWNGQYKFFLSWLDDPTLTSPVFPWEEEVLRESLDDYERALMEKFPEKATLDRIKWRRETIRGKMQDHSTLEPEQYFMQEFPATEEEMFQSTSVAVFNQEALSVMELMLIDPILTAKMYAFADPRKVMGGANLTIFEEPKYGHAYSFGGDVSGGVGLDYSCGVMLDRMDGTSFREVACFHDNKIDPRDVGHVWTTLCEYYNDAFCTVEVLGPGLSTNKAIVEDNRFPWVFHRAQLDQVQSALAHGESFRYGYWTSQQGKNAIIQEVRPLIRDSLLILRSLFGIAEMKLYSEDEGKYNAPDGYHDDYVIALCLAVFGAFRQAPSLRALAHRAATKEARYPDLPKEDSEVWQMAMTMINYAVKRSKERNSPGYLPSSE